MASLAEILAKKKALQQATVNVASPTAEPITTKASVTDSMIAQLAEATVKAEAKIEEVKTEVSSATNFDDILDAPLGKTDARILEEAQITTADIVPRIRQLSSLSEANLESEMKLLKAALMANPEAVKLMLPEDVGEMVVALRRMTKEAIISEASKKASKAKKPTKVVAADLWTTVADDF